MATFLGTKKFKGSIFDTLPPGNPNEHSKPKQTQALKASAKSINLHVQNPKSARPQNCKKPTQKSITTTTPVHHHHAPGSTCTPSPARPQCSTTPKPGTAPALYPEPRHEPTTQQWAVRTMQPKHCLDPENSLLTVNITNFLKCYL